MRSNARTSHHLLPTRSVSSLISGVTRLTEPVSVVTLSVLVEPHRYERDRTPTTSPPHDIFCSFVDADSSATIMQPCGLSKGSTMESNSASLFIGSCDFTGPSQQWLPHFRVKPAAFVQVTDLSYILCLVCCTIRGTLGSRSVYRCKL